MIEWNSNGVDQLAILVDVNRSSVSTVDILLSKAGGDFYFAIRVRFPTSNREMDIAIVVAIRVAAILVDCCPRHVTEVGIPVVACPVEIVVVREIDEEICTVSVALFVFKITV